MLILVFIILMIQSQQILAQNQIPNNNQQPFIRLVKAISFAATLKANASRALLSMSEVPVNDEDAEFRKFLESISKVDAKIIEKHVVQGYMHYLSIEDADALSEFFESSTGKKITFGAVNIGDPKSNQDKIIFTEDDKTQFNKIRETDSYKKYSRLAVSREFSQKIMESLFQDFTSNGLK